MHISMIHERKSCLHLYHVHVGALTFIIDQEADMGNPRCIIHDFATTVEIFHNGHNGARESMDIPDVCWHG